ncbi:MAG: protein-glutamate O-methyltransferase CheR, partial [Symploca sp. SIO3E6]|nr:protein-glutamate O-methyltransferase CheR [Caldora sp. SIO3E6]
MKTMVQGAIEALLRTKIGFDPKIIGSSTIAKAVRQRQLACSLPDVSAYLRQLQTSSQELSELIEQVVVPETWFFRHQEAFSFLSHYVKSEWLPIHPYSRLRVLSIPCSTGEEPYSTAITLIEAGLAPDKFNIDAIDISHQVILKAIRGVYSNNSFRGKKLAFRERYFQQTVEGYQLCNLVKKTVNFLQGNLLNPLFLAKRGKYDVIFCRNLLIYFEPAARKRAVDILTSSLTTRGLLFVGCAETGQMITNGFVSVKQPFTFAYRRVEGLGRTRGRGDAGTRRWGDGEIGEMGRWGDGEMGRRGDAGTRGRGDEETREMRRQGRWGDGEMG